VDDPLGHVGEPAEIEVRGLTIGYGGRAVQRELGFSVRKGEVFVVMGDSGCGKSTLLRQMVGLDPPLAGEVFYSGEAFWGASDERRARMQARLGVLFQQGALLSTMTLEENVSLVLTERAALPPVEARAVARLKLALVGLAGFERHYPGEISGGMKKRAGLARAIALDPEILYFDEPSAGLDPLSGRRLDDLILELRDALGATVVLVTHDLASIFALGDNAVFLDAERQTMTAQGKPEALRDGGEAKLRAFLTRGRQ
jgi:phospholipid/cholesterol/gamma-HCH transport system ATP-binding protein